MHVCLLESQYLNLGSLPLALGIEPLEKDWLLVDQTLGAEAMSSSSP